MSLRRKILALLRQRLGPAGLPLRLVFWDGESFDFGPAPKIAITFTEAAILRAMVRGDIDALADAYVAGTLEVEGRLQDILGVGIALAERMGRYAWLGRLGKLAFWRRFRHSRAADAAAISHHYDVSNDFYALWLDRRMVYSCAYFHRGDEDIDTAQAQKLDHICRKLRLQPGEKFLDIGCGWGGLVLWAAQHYGVNALGVTLSRSQYDEARKRVAETGLESRVEIRLADYRDLKGEAMFDKIASVGMYEHVGLAKLPDYFATLHRLLKVNGLALNHGITTGHPEGGSLGPQGSSFIDRYVFPGGELPHLTGVIAETARQKLETLDVENLRPHYTETLLRWVRRLEANRERALALAGPERYRIWRIYMAGSALAFDRGWLSLYQVLAIKPDPDGHAARPWTRRHQYVADDPATLSRPMEWGDL